MANVVKRVVINKLYDIYDYDISFDRGNVTLMTGPNGYGKTTILNIIKNALDLNLWYFYELLYDSIEIYWSNDTMLSIKKLPVVLKVEPQYILFDDEEKVEQFSDDESYKVEVSHKDLKGKSIDSITLDKQKLSSLKDKLRGFSHHDIFFEFNPLSDTEKLSKSDTDLRGKFKELRLFANQSNCMFVQSQRIYSDRELSRYEDRKISDKYTITELAERIKEMYESEQRSYVEKSQQIDSTFIQRQLRDNHVSYSLEDYKKKIDELKKKIANFERYGLIEKYNLVEDYNEKLSNVLSMHINDMNDKFSVYDKFYAKLERFDKFVSGKGWSNKEMKLDSVNGITFVSKSGRIIPLHKLSSGEQNLVILYFRLVFETNNETLLLMDEPENSIHVEWLKEMLNDYLEMENTLHCQMLIATHSIPFIDGHWNISYDLFKGSYQD